MENIAESKRNQLNRLFWWWIDFYHMKEAKALENKHLKIAFAFTLKPLWTLGIFLTKITISVIHIVYVAITWPIALICGFRPIPLWHEMWLSLTLHSKELHWRIGRYEEYRLWRVETTIKGNERKVYMPLSFIELLPFLTIPPVVFKLILLVMADVGRTGSIFMIVGIILLPILWLEIFSLIIRRGGETKIEYKG